VSPHGGRSPLEIWLAAVVLCLSTVALLLGSAPLSTLGVIDARPVGVAVPSERVLGARRGGLAMIGLRPLSSFCDPSRQQGVEHPKPGRGGSVLGDLTSINKSLNRLLHRTSSGAPIAAAGSVDTFPSPGHCREGSPLGSRQSRPYGSQLVANVSHNSIERGQPRLLRRLLAFLGQLPKDVCQEHRSLRVAVRHVEQRRQCRAKATPRCFKAERQVVSDIVRSKRWKIDGSRLAIEGPATVGKEVAHHPDLRAGEDIAGRVAVVLNLSPDDRVGAIGSRQDVLELIEDHKSPRAVFLMEPSRQCEAIDKRRLGLRINLNLDPRGNRTSSDLERRSKQSPCSREPGRQPPLQLGGIGTLNPLRDVIERQDSEEVHVNRCPSLTASVLGNSSEQRSLPIATRRHKTAVVAADRAIQEFARLLVSIQQLVRRDGLAVAKWISALSHRANLLAMIERNETPDSLAGFTLEAAN
jgi:hypothetical protein